MTTYCVLLRAINVGGHNKIPMAELRDLLGELKFASVATYIQSGNIVCSSARKAPSVRSVIKAGIADRFGHDIEVIVRTADEVADIVASWPFGETDPKASGVVFLAGDFDGDLDTSKFAPDRCLTAGAHIFLDYASSFSESKLTPAWIESQTGVAGTRRNWRTVLKLQEMLQS